MDKNEDNFVDFGEILAIRDISDMIFIEINDMFNGDVEHVIRVRDISAVCYEDNKCVVYLASGVKLYVRGTPAGIKEMIYDALDM